jgi:nucleotide-binding universal stress UspA family protein
MCDTILVPTDGSTAARNALEHAIDLAAAFDTEIRGLYVVDISTSGSLGGYEPIAGRLNGIGRKALSTVSRLANEADVESETELREGAACREINDYCTESDADAIIMGPRGRSKLDRMHQFNFPISQLRRRNWRSSTRSSPAG